MDPQIHLPIAKMISNPVAQCGYPQRGFSFHIKTAEQKLKTATASRGAKGIASADRMSTAKKIGIRLYEKYLQIH